MGEITKELERIAKRLHVLHDRRDQLITSASTEGLSLRKIARAADLSHTAIAKILAKREITTLGRDDGEDRTT